MTLLRSRSRSALLLLLLACEREGVRPDIAPAAAGPDVADSFAAVPDSAWIEVQGPTMIGFFPLASNDELERDADLAELLDHFSFNLGMATDSLEARGFRVTMRSGDTLWLRGATRRWRFIRAADSALAGFYVTLPNADYAVRYGTGAEFSLPGLADAFLGAGAVAQGCRVPESIRVAIPDEVPTTGPYSTLASGPTPFAEVALGIGHLHHSPANPVQDLPPGADAWLQRVELPLSASPGAEPFAWIAGGWVMTPGEPSVALTMTGLVETGYEEPSFVVLERRSDHWFRIRYATEGRDEGTAWIPACALEASPARLAFSPWSDWFLSDRVTPMFFRVPILEELRSAPAPESASLARISSGYILIPLEVRGDWMRVELRQPSDFCAPGVTATRREGWVRWYAPDVGPRIWYFTRGC